MAIVVALGVAVFAVELVWYLIAPAAALNVARLPGIREGNRTG